MAIWQLKDHAKGPIYLGFQFPYLPSWYSHSQGDTMPKAPVPHLLPQPAPTPRAGILWCLHPGGKGRLLGFFWLVALLSYKTNRSAFGGRKKKFEPKGLIFRQNKYVSLWSFQVLRQPRRWYSQDASGWIYNFLAEKAEVWSERNQSNLKGTPKATECLGLTGLGTRHPLIFLMTRKWPEDCFPPFSTALD